MVDIVTDFKSIAKIANLKALDGHPQKEPVKLPAGVAGPDDAIPVPVKLVNANLANWRYDPQRDCWIEVASG